MTGTEDASVLQLLPDEIGVTVYFELIAIDNYPPAKALASPLCQQTCPPARPYRFRRELFDPAALVSIKQAARLLNIATATAEFFERDFVTNSLTSIDPDTLPRSRQSVVVVPNTFSDGQLQHLIRVLQTSPEILPRRLPV